MSWENMLKVDSIREPMVPKVALGDLMGEVMALVELIEKDHSDDEFLPIHAQKIRDEIELLKRSGL